GHKAFKLEGYSSIRVYESAAEVLDLTLSSGPAIPTAVTACLHCGAITEHALGSAGVDARKAGVVKEGDSVFVDALSKELTINAVHVNVAQEYIMITEDKTYRCLIEWKQ